MQQALINAKFGSVPLTKVFIKNQLIAMTTIVAQLTLVTPLPDNVNIHQLFALTKTNVLLIVATLKKVVSTLQRTATTTMHAPLTLAISQ
jgi:hypothetical protein